MTLLSVMLKIEFHIQVALYFTHLEYTTIIWQTQNIYFINQLELV